MRNQLGKKRCRGSITVTILSSFLVSALPEIHWANTPASVPFPLLSAPYRELKEKNLFVQNVFHGENSSMSPTECSLFVLIIFITNINTMFIQSQVNGIMGILVNSICMLLHHYFPHLKFVWGNFRLNKQKKSSLKKNPQSSPYFPLLLKRKEIQV